MQSHLELELKENRCALWIKGHANFRLACNHLEQEEVQEIIINGERRNNDRGRGYIYQKGVIEVVARWKRCHCHVTTIYNKNKNNNSNQDKNERIKKYMESDKVKTCPRCEKADLEFGLKAIEVSGEVIGEFQGLECPNCKYICFDAKTSKEIQAIIKTSGICPITPEDISLILLYALDSPINGAIVFMKEAFLLFEEKLKEFKVPTLSPKFISYLYGPYSFDIDESWNSLEQFGLIQITGKRSTPKEIFSLTIEGKEEAKKIFESLPKALQEELPCWRKGFDQLQNGILKDVYLRYPQYTDKSKIKDRVLPKRMHGRA